MRKMHAEMACVNMPLVYVRKVSDAVTLPNARGRYKHTHTHTHTHNTHTHKVPQIRL
jgi:hypothetical protein